MPFAEGSVVTQVPLCWGDGLLGVGSTVRSGAAEGSRAGPAATEDEAAIATPAMLAGTAISRTRAHTTVLVALGVRPGPTVAGDPAMASAIATRDKLLWDAAGPLGDRLPARPVRCPPRAERLERSRGAGDTPSDRRLVTGGAPCASAAAPDARTGPAIIRERDFPTQGEQPPAE